MILARIASQSPRWFSANHIIVCGIHSEDSGRPFLERINHHVLGRQRRRNPMSDLANIVSSLSLNHVVSNHRCRSLIDVVCLLRTHLIPATQNCNKTGVPINL
eukprot:238007_1